MRNAPHDEGCAFILGDGAGRSICGVLRKPGSSYCRRHHALCRLPPGSIAEQLRLREIAALADAAGGRLGHETRCPPAQWLRRIERLARAFSRADRSCFVQNGEIDGEGR